MPTMDRFSAHLGYMFTEQPLRQRFAEAAKCGFRAVEHPGPYEIPAVELKRLLKDNGLGMAQIALPAGDASRGEKGLACFPDRKGDFEDALQRGLDYAANIECPMVHMMAGVIAEDVDKASLLPIYLERLSSAAEAARIRNLTLLIEPIGIGTIANYYMDDPHAALRAIEAVGKDNVRLLFDSFHATGSGVDASEFVARHSKSIAHVHIADVPGRHEPGTGMFPFPRFFSALAQADYAGLVGLEYIPAADTVEGLAWLRDPSVCAPA